MDIDRVGIFGCSAGGQESTGAVLFHPEFYKAAYSACGCHDNRMDKIWWNELWMGYPVDESYSACSNVDNAHRLTRPLMLVVGEMDDNVDPASTMQVVNALIKAGKDFDLVVIPGARHTMGEDFGEHKRYDFFVRHLLGTHQVNRPISPAYPTTESALTAIVLRPCIRSLRRKRLFPKLGYACSLHRKRTFPAYGNDSFLIRERAFPLSARHKKRMHHNRMHPFLSQMPSLTCSSGASVA